MIGQQRPTQPTFGPKRFILDFVNNREEALMYNVLAGCCAYLFNLNDAEFYVKDNANITGQCTFTDYIYEERKHQEPVVQNGVLTSDDLSAMEQRITQNILNALQKQKGDEICG